MNTVAEAPQDTKTERLNIVFATSPDGRVFEIPSNDASKFEITPEQEVEMGGLPIHPYNLMSEPTTSLNVAVKEENEVEGRDYHTQGYCRFYPTYVHYGCYVARDGCVYRGRHFHPNGGTIGIPSC